MSVKFKIIDKLGGQKAVLDALNAPPRVNGTVSYRAMRLWHTEQKIPPARQMQLIKIAEGQGIDWTFGDFEPVEDKVPA